MRVGILGEDRGHEAVVRGLVARWCPGAEVVVGEYRGRGKRRRRQLRDTLPRMVDLELCDCVVLLVDANEERWQEAAQREMGFVMEEYRHRAIVGAPQRNIECWL